VDDAQTTVQVSGERIAPDPDDSVVLIVRRLRVRRVSPQRSATSRRQIARDPPATGQQRILSDHQRR